MPNTLARLRNLPLAHRRRWLRCVLVAVAFSALHGLLGAWVVPAVASGPVAQVCTPAGVQWVALDGTDAVPGNRQGPGAPMPQGWLHPCAWAMAHVAVPPAWAVTPGNLTPDSRLAGPGLASRRLQSWPGNIERVLLMAPMRAPPA